MATARSDTLAIIGSAGVPMRYGGFEAFVEHCGPKLLRHFSTVVVSCDATLYPDRAPEYRGMRRIFPAFRANGPQSILHDLLAFINVLPTSKYILVLGVSGGPWFPLMRLLCMITGAVLAVNVDGVEWQRGKFSTYRKLALRIFDWLAQRCAHLVIYDNAALEPYILAFASSKKQLIAYSGEHASPTNPHYEVRGVHALTVCRIEPENSIEMLIRGFLASDADSYTIIGNWESSAHGRSLRAKYNHESRLRLLDPVYDPGLLREYRSQCTVYLHGHTVGGTNPSLVEMLFFNCRILCIDVPYHRHTAAQCAEYFRNSDELARLLTSGGSPCVDRSALRQLYTSDTIARKYAEALRETDFYP